MLQEWRLSRDTSYYCIWSLVKKSACEDAKVKGAKVDLLVPRSARTVIYNLLRLYVAKRPRKELFTAMNLLDVSGEASCGAGQFLSNKSW
jgi:hypothetical protein